MAVTAYRKTVGTTSVELVVSDGDGLSALVRNRGSGAVYIGGDDVDSAGGFELRSGYAASFDLSGREILYAVSGGTEVVHVIANRT